MTMTFIQSQTLGSDGTPSFQNIPQTFTHLQVRAFVRSSRSGFSDEWMVLRFNNDTNNNYSTHLLWGTGAGSANIVAYSSVNFAFGSLIPPNQVDANMWGVSVIDILDYANTNKNKTIRTLGGYDTNTTASINNIALLASGAWYSTAGITRIDIVGNATMRAGSRFDLYGIGVSEQTGA